MTVISKFTPGSSVTVQAAPQIISGVSAQVAAVVGTATQGPVNVATPITAGSFQRTFGLAQPVKHDGGTVVAEAGLNGAGTIYFTRVTDGTDVAASNTAVANAHLTALTTGSGYNGTVITYSTAGVANAITVSITSPNGPTEVFLNLPASNASVFWNSHDAAINSGTGVLRGASDTIRANTTTAVILPTLPSSVTLTGGTDGATGVTATTLLGTDGTTKTGMYTLRNFGIQYAVLADADDANTYTTQAAFGEAENILMIATLPAGEAISNAVATVQSAGLGGFSRTVLLHGDWLTINDPTNGLRKVSPQGFYLGTRASLLPNETVLNKPMAGIQGSETSLAGNPYTTAQTETLFSAGIDLIGNPIPVGAVWGVKGGYTTCANQAENSDAWATMTNFLAQTLKQAGGPWVGKPNTVRNRASITASINHFLDGLKKQDILAPTSTGGVPYSVICDNTNNTADNITLGVLNVNVYVQYEGIIRFFNVSLQGGAGVVITSTTVGVAQ